MVEDIVGLRELSEMLNPVEAVSLVLVEADDPLEVLVCILMHIASKVLPSILVPPYDVLSAVLTLAVLINCGMLPEVLSFKVVSTGVLAPRELSPTEFVLFRAFVDSSVIPSVADVSP